MRNLIGSKSREDYQAHLYTGPSKENLYLCLHLNREFPDLPYKFEDFCASNNISCEVVGYEPPDFRFRFQNTEVHIEHTLPGSQRFYLGTHVMYGREFINFYRMFRQFFEFNDFDLSPVDDLIFNEKVQEFIKKGEEKLVGRVTSTYFPPIRETTQVYEEVKSELQRMMDDIDIKLKQRALVDVGIDLHTALKKRDDEIAQALMGRYVRIASQLDIDPRPGLEAILNSV